MPKGKIKVTIVGNSFKMLGHTFRVERNQHSREYDNAACSYSGNELIFGEGYLIELNYDWEKVEAICAHEIGHLTCIRNGEKNHMLAMNSSPLDAIFFGKPSYVAGGEVAADRVAMDMIGAQRVFDKNHFDSGSWYYKDGWYTTSTYSDVMSARMVACIDRLLDEQGLNDFHL